MLVQTYLVRDYYRARPWATALLPEHMDSKPGAYLQCLTGGRRCAPGAFARLAALYRAELPELDKHIGRLLRVLRTSGHEKNTVVAFVSDHGEAFDSRRRRIHHGGRLHADQLRVPFFLRVPEVSPRVVHAPVSLVDVMPTLLELAGASPPRRIDGESLASLVRGRKDGSQRPIFAMEHRFKWVDGVRLEAETVAETPVILAVMTDGHWMIYEHDHEELYDFRDLEQRRDLTAGGGSQELMERMRRIGDQRLRSRYPARGVAVADGVLERLHALGHVE
jgi:arylsulfatase A-like enzyme